MNSADEPNPPYNEAAERAFRLRWIERPLRDFLETETSGAVLLFVAALAALVLANSALASNYESMWESTLTLGIGRFSIEEDLRHWVNEGLMAVFFFVVGLEIKRELVAGELRSPRRAALPAIAALGGMVVPALIYLALNQSTDAVRGWGIPMATDIAFAVGMLALFSRRVPAALKTFLLTLAIVDDIGAITVVALFYSDDVEPLALAVAGGLVVAGYALLRADVQKAAPYALLGVALWVAIHESGVHATITGVLLAALIPARLGDDAPVLHETTPSLLARLEHALHPFASFLIVPLFAFANAGVEMAPGDVSKALTGHLGLGVVLGLVAGKLIGITLFTAAAQHLGLGQLHPSLHLRHLVAVAAVAGIGFTVSLFFVELAFSDAEKIEEAKVSVLCGSLVAGALGAALLAALPRAENPVD